MIFMRGFTLFAPLVGTLIILISILVASVMVLNDTETARSLSYSYETSSQSTAGVLIRSAARLQIAENIRNYFDDPNSEFFKPFEIKCTKLQDGVSCDYSQALNSRITKAQNDFSLSYDVTYSGVLDSIEAATDYAAVDKSKAKVDLSNGLDSCFPLMKVSYNNDWVTVKLNQQALAGCDVSYFTVDFVSNVDKSKKVTVSILPSQDEYHEFFLPRSIFEDSKESYENAVSKLMKGDISFDNSLCKYKKGVSTNFYKLGSDYGAKFLYYVNGKQLLIEYYTGKTRSTGPLVIKSGDYVTCV